MDELPLILFAREDSKKKTRKPARAADSPAEIAAVVRQDQRRGRQRRRVRRTIRPAAERRLEPDLGRLDRDDLGYPLILLEEAAAHCGGGSADGRLVLKAKLACAGALLARGRRFDAARRTEEIIRHAIVMIGNGRPGESGLDAGRRDQIRHRVLEGRSLLESYLGQN